MEQKHRDNLEKLASFVLKNDSPLVFDMTHLNYNPTLMYRALPDEAAKSPCGTYACLAGHGPAAGILPESFEAKGDWDCYIEESFGIYACSILRPTSSPWQWLFGAYWRLFDPSYIGAALRVFWFLDFGMPTDFDLEKENPWPTPYLSNEPDIQKWRADIISGKRWEKS